MFYTDYQSWRRGTSHRSIAAKRAGSYNFNQDLLFLMSWQSCMQAKRPTRLRPESQQDEAVTVSIMGLVASQHCLAQTNSLNDISTTKNAFDPKAPFQ